jgi:phospholipase D1/2
MVSNSAFPPASGTTAAAPTLSEPASDREIAAGDDNLAVATHLAEASPSGSRESRDQAQALLRPGQNCWRIEHARHFSMLVDAQAYFSAARAAIRQARHSVFILGWDLDSRMLLVPGGADDGYPEELAEFLQALVAERPELNIYVLNWDFAVLYALEREFLPAYRESWARHERLQFHMDDRHPIGASHHQKVLVVDDALAFVGGLDLTRCRWDTSEHASDAPLRRDPDGNAYAPFHDVQAMVDGDVAAALGELARSRWLTARGKDAVPAPDDRPDLWPANVVADIDDVRVAISRTEPAWEGSAGVHEVRQLHLDAIAAARRRLFYENQYFTSGLLANALAARLGEDDAPDVVVISPALQSGWLEESTMGLLRARLHRRLTLADRHDRYRLLCPHLPDLEVSCLNVHSKVFVMDDRLVSIGSANLSSRSMAFDTECCLAIEAGGDEAQTARLTGAISHMRDRLLAEHLACTPETVAGEIERAGLCGAIAALHGPGRTLKPIDPVVNPDLDKLIPERALFDPERPLDSDGVFAAFVPKDARKPMPRRLLALGAVALLLVSLTLAWRYTPLREWASLESLIGLARSLEAMPFTGAAVVASFVIGGLIMVPVTLMIAVTGIVFGPLWGLVYALGGTACSAAVTYGLGMWLGRETVRKVLGPRINRLSRRIAKRGILAMVVVRVLPIAPFTVINVVAGASHIRFLDFIVGSLLGLLPGIVLTVTFIHNLAEVIRNPTPGTIALLVGAAVLLIAVAIVLQRVLGPKVEADAS